MNTTLAILAVVSFMAAIYACGRRDVGGAAAGTVGAVLFGILAILVGGDHERDRWDAHNSTQDRNSHPRPFLRVWAVSCERGWGQEWGWTISSW
jgi:hypothetical protein